MAEAKFSYMYAANLKRKKEEKRKKGRERKRGGGKGREEKEEKRRRFTQPSAVKPSLKHQVHFFWFL